MADFFHMGGYAFYVWTSFGLGTAVLLFNAWRARLNLQRAKVEARRRLAMRETP